MYTVIQKKIPLFQSAWKSELKKFKKNIRNHGWTKVEVEYIKQNADKSNLLPSEEISGTKVIGKIEKSLGSDGIR